MAASKFEALHAFIKFQHPNITLIPPNSPSYIENRATFIIDEKKTPLAIVRPQTAQDVAALISFSTANKIQLVIRSGGNNLYGLSCEHDALMIDVRGISYVKIDDEKSSAKIGGGISLLTLARELSKEGLATAFASVSWIGYVGWATYGGYGPYSANYGLGVDNIIGAKIVNYKGEIVDADPKMLKGIRGAGGFLGAIVELTIKVYPLNAILSGMVMFEAQNIGSSFQSVTKTYRKLLAEGYPTELNLQPVVVNTPGGIIFAICFTWSSEDQEKGREWLARVEALGPVVMNTVQASTIPASMELVSSMFATQVYGTITSISIRTMSEEASTVIARNLERMPATFGAALSIHELRGQSASLNPNSVFTAREPHFVLELIGTVAKLEDAKDAVDWITTFWEEMKKIDPENILESTYISLTPPEHLDLSKIYASNLETIKDLKREYDPENAFNLAIPRIKRA